MRYLLLMLLFVNLLFSDSLGWSHDYKKALENAKVQHKLVYILITSDYCRWCRKFENTTLQDKGIKKRLQDEFIRVHLSREEDEIPKQFKTTPVPRHYFTDADGEIVYASLGYRKVECFSAFMDNAQNKIKVSN